MTITKETRGRLRQILACQAQKPEFKSSPIFARKCPCGGTCEGGCTGTCEYESLKSDCTILF